MIRQRVVIVFVHLQAALDLFIVGDLCGIEPLGQIDDDIAGLSCLACVDMGGFRSTRVLPLDVEADNVGLEVDLDLGVGFSARCVAVDDLVSAEVCGELNLVVVLRGCGGDSGAAECQQHDDRGRHRPSDARSILTKTVFR